MKSIRLLHVVFDQAIAPHELPAFRGAIIKKVGLSRELYHNHNNAAGTTAAYHYRYPLIQYKRLQKRPSILFIEEGVEQAQYFFKNPDWALSFSGQTYAARIADLNVKQFDTGICYPPRAYRLSRWLALNQENFQHYRQLSSLRDKLAFLENILAGHLLGFGKGIGLHYKERVEVEILDILKDRLLPYGDTRLLAFDVVFRANTALPYYVGIGRGAARGYGILSAPPKKCDTYGVN